jgi:retron-type reverse transcriptase
MKRANDLLSKVAEPDNLRLAAWKAAKGKRHSQEVLAWSANLDDHLTALRKQILSGQVTVGRYRYFKVYEPKERQICASAFGEQVLHHALMNVCHPFFERAQVFDSYASRKGKGTYAALERAKWYTKRNEWYLKLDVRKFFETVHHEVLTNQLTQMFRDAALVGIFEQILNSYQSSPGRGLPIGNLTSQYFANHYLAGLDRFVKEKLRVKSYTRYMDDMVCWHSEKMSLQSILSAINDFVENELRCTLKPEALNRTRCGLPFLGYHIFPHHVRLLQKSKHRFIQKLQRIETGRQSEDWDEAKCQRRVLPLIAFTAHANAKNLRQRILLGLKGQSP